MLLVSKIALLRDARLDANQLADGRLLVRLPWRLAQKELLEEFRKIDGFRTANLPDPMEGQPESAQMISSTSSEQLELARNVKDRLPVRETCKVEPQAPTPNLVGRGRHQHRHCNGQ